MRDVCFFHDVYHADRIEAAFVKQTKSRQGPRGNAPLNPLSNIQINSGA
jgi:hypothetical protein